MSECQECERKLADHGNQLECLQCDLTPICEKCYNEIHSKCAEIDEDWDVDDEYPYGEDEDQSD